MVSSILRGTKDGGGSFCNMSRLSVVARKMDLENLAEVGAEWGLTTKMWYGNFRSESQSGGPRGRQSLQTGKRAKTQRGEGASA